MNPTRSLTLAIALVATLATAAHAQEHRIEVGDDPHAIVASAPIGSTFVFAAGVHFVPEPIVPRSGDTFRGEDGAILTGAVELGAAEQRGAFWVVDDVPPISKAHGSCIDDVILCDFREDVYLDDVPLNHVASAAEVGPGNWYYDADNQDAVLGEDPSGRTLKMGVSSGAFIGNANHVTIENLTIETFANRAQRGAIHAYGSAYPVTPGHAWIIRGNTVRLNHGVGIAAGHGAQIVENHVIRNGQVGITSNGGADTIVARNEIAFNNYAQFTFHWEGGATKFRETTRLQVLDNHVHHNNGPGLWGDWDNIDTLYAGNLVEHNASTGIFHEVSYDARIVDNVVRYNALEVGQTWYAYVFGSGILVYNSRNVEVARNVVIGNWNGITGLMHDRGSGVHGPWELRNLDVHDNVIHMGFNERGVRPGGGPGNGQGIQAISGILQGHDQVDVFSEEFDNRFHDNVYLIADPNMSYWSWGNTMHDYLDWQACGGAGSQYAYAGCVQDADAEVRFVTDSDDLAEVARRLGPSAN